MKHKNDVLNEIRNFFETIDKNYSKSGSIKERQTNILNALEKFKIDFESEENKQELDKLLKKILEKLEDNSNLEITKDILKDEDKTQEFIMLEKQINDILINKLKVNDIKKIIGTSEINISKFNNIDEIKKNIPASTDEFLNQIESWIIKTADTLKDSQNKSRKKKKKERQNEKFRIFGFGCGIIMAIGNILLSANNLLPDKVATTSITIGAGGALTLPSKK